jgi:hypothetical protein
MVSSGTNIVAEIKIRGRVDVDQLPRYLRRRRHHRDHRPNGRDGGSVQPAPVQPFLRLSIDLPDIAFGVQTTIAYAE